MRKKKFVLSIAGLDPCAGAGLLADIKTFEFNNTYGLGVCSAITFQNESKTNGVSWLPFTTIQNQLTPLFETYNIDCAKIGLIESLKVLQQVIDLLKNLNPKVKIIWDPILKSSSGFVFHQNTNEQKTRDVLKDIFLFTPNLEEIKTLFPFKDPEKTCVILGATNAVLLKGGHNTGKTSKDLLFYNGKINEFEALRQKTDKHGTGCVLSSTITANLSNGYSIEESCQKGKLFINSFLSSTENLLGYYHLESEKTHL